MRRDHIQSFQNCFRQSGGVAVVFVHGLFGDTLGTWTHANGGTFFKYLKASPQVGAQVDVFAFGFTSKMLGSGSLDIREAANKLHEKFVDITMLPMPGRARPAPAWRALLDAEGMCRDMAGGAR